MFMDITFLNQIDDEAFSSFENYLKPLLKKTLEVTNFDVSVSVSVVLVNDKEIHQYNKDFRNIDRPTDVLSFVDGETFDGILSLGDIIVSNETCRRQAEEYGHSLKREFLFLVVHGYLHLLGYDHINPEDEREMLRLQKEILDNVVKRSDA